MLALLPSATTAILEAMNTEQITYEIQQMKATKAIKNGAAESITPPSIADTTLTEDDGKSMVSQSIQSESGIHASQIATPSPFAAGGEAGQQDGASLPKPRKTKRQLWDDVTISGKSSSSQHHVSDSSHANSRDAILHAHLHPRPTDVADPGAT